MIDNDAMLKARIDDAVRLSKVKPQFIGFLDPSEADFAKNYTKHNHAAEFSLYGGWEDSERVIFAVYRDYNAPTEFPITPVTFLFREQDELSHRDFLGAFMSQGVVRISLGDILIEKGRAVVFVKAELAEYFLQNTVKIGKTGVHGTIGAVLPLPPSHQFETMTGVIASGRLDCLVAFLAKMSREKAASTISSGLVTVNHKEICSISYQIHDTDKIAVRSIGKFVIDRLGPLTKKGRLTCSCRKYK